MARVIVVLLLLSLLKLLYYLYHHHWIYVDIYWLVLLVLFSVWRLAIRTQIFHGFSHFIQLHVLIVSSNSDWLWQIPSTSLPIHSHPTCYQHYSSVSSTPASVVFGYKSKPKTRQIWQVFIVLLSFSRQMSGQYCRLGCACFFSYPF
jgi:hypothetical protein